MAQLKHQLAEVNELLSYSLYLCSIQRSGEAVSRLKNVAKGIFKKDGLIWLTLGEVLFHDYRYKEARSAISNACRLAPRSALIHYHAADLLNRIGHHGAALKLLEKTRSFGGASVLPFVERARLLERMHEFERAEAEINSGLKKDPRSVDCLIMKGVIQRRQRQWESAEQTLEDAIAKAENRDQRLKAGYELASTLDKVGNYREAFRVIQESKALLLGSKHSSDLQKIWAASLRQSDEHLQHLKAGGFDHSLQIAKKLSDYQKAPPLLMGHPRSGTTLLEQVLDSHPEMSTMDESNVMAQRVIYDQRVAAEDLREQTGESSKWLSENQGRLRRRYKSAMVELMLQRGKGQGTVIDKHPAHTVDLPWIVSVMPDAQIILALRDPRDVIISCFFLGAPLNRFSTNWLSIEGAARSYGEIMGSFFSSAELLSEEQIISVKYEDVVKDLAIQGARATEFLGKDWVAEQEEFHLLAKDKVVRSPTYESVNQPIYNTAVSRWENYQKDAAQVFETLEPWLHKLGYT